MDKILKQVDTQSLELFPIEAPGLDKPDYGKNIKEQFENIDDNFKLIANRDFVKGDPGNSLYIENISLDVSRDGIGGELYSALKQAITEQFNSEGALEPVNSYNWDDSITSGGLNVPIIVSRNETNGEPEYICAASPVMLFDNRFNDKAINEEDFSNYEDVVDVTSILNFKKEDGVWKCELNLSYPRLQYKDGSFCWVINNENTIVKSTGIKGDPGERANIWLVKISELPDAFQGTQINISQYFVNDIWTQSAPEGIETGDLAIVYCESTSKDYYGFFVSQIKVEGNNNMVVYDPNGNIQNINYEKNTTEFFKSLGKGNAAKGMFLKFQPSGSSTQSHMLYNAGENLYIKPVNNYDDVTETYNGNSSSINIVDYDNINLEGVVNIGGASLIEQNDGELEINAKEVEITGGGLTITNGKIDMNGVTLTRQNNNSLEINAPLVEIIGGCLTVERFTDLQSGLSVSTDLEVGGPTTLYGDLTVKGDLIDLTVDNGASGLQITPDGNTISCGICKLEVAEDVITLNGLTEIYGDLTVNGGDSKLKITDNGISISFHPFNIKVEDGGITLNGSAMLNNGLTVTGTTKLDENLEVSKTASVQNLCVKNMYLSLDDIPSLGADGDGWQYLGQTSNGRYAYTPTRPIFGIYGGTNKNYDGKILVVFKPEVFPSRHMLILDGGNQPNLSDFHIYPTRYEDIYTTVAVDNAKLIWIGDEELKFTLNTAGTEGFNVKKIIDFRIIG